MNFFQWQQSKSVYLAEFLDIRFFLKFGKKIMDFFGWSFEVRYEREWLANVELFHILRMKEIKVDKCFITTYYILLHIYV
jgi:hypothetical protein